MAYDLRNTDNSLPPTLEILPDGRHVSPQLPAKCIENGEDLSFFLGSKAYADIMTFVLQLNRAMVPLKDDAGTTHTWPLNGPHLTLSDNVRQMASLIQSLRSIMDRAPPETGPRRFGNVAFRTWYKAAQESAIELLKDTLSEAVWTHVEGEAERGKLEKELEAYLLGGFGSSERLDYGTGHELSFMAFLGCVWKLGGFAQAPEGVEERGIVVGIIQPYLELIRSLILTYTLEPAGSHGVWGLDDHSFLPYIFGSAQYCPPTRTGATLPTEGSLQGAPSPGCIAKRNFVEQYRSQNMYFSAIGFIFDVKKGAFWEHSPTLYDISGIKDGWAKINKGMIKMFNAEVLSKFPVVQHFPFGGLFRWEADPRVVGPAPSVHVNVQPSRTTDEGSRGSQPPRLAMAASGNAQASHGVKSGQSAAGTAAPWSSGPANSSRTTMPVSQGGFGVVPGRMPMTTTAMPLRYNASGGGHSRPFQAPTQIPKQNRE